MYKSILLAVDLAHEGSWSAALPAAAELARRDGATLHLMTVVLDFGLTMIAGYLPQDFEQRTLERARADLAAFAAEKAPKDVTVETHLAHGHAAEEILEAAGRVDADLIVMASHTPDMMRTLFVGSVADKVVHGAPCSVLIVRS
jgi:universal stress protein F